MEKIRAAKGALTLIPLVICCCNIITTVNARRVIVGGEQQHWHFGFNYTDWALNAGPFRLHDTLVFMYARPNGSIYHDVYRLQDFNKFQACDFQGAQRLTHENGGVDSGFAYVLKERKPHYFACGIHAGVHCRIGLMKFSVNPS